MKRLITLRIVNIINLLILAILFAWLYLSKVNLTNIWYIILITFLDISLYAKFIIFKSDNVLWFAICLTLLVAFMCLYNLKIIDIRFYPLILVSPAVASILLFLTYKNTLHLCLIVLFAIIGGSFFILSFNLVNVWWFLLIEVGAILVSVALINLIHNIYIR